MAGSPHAWVTQAPADYMLVCIEDPDGDHAVVRARFADNDQVFDAGRDLERAELNDRELRAYCTLLGEADGILARVQDAPAQTAWIESVTLAFVAVGDGSGTNGEAAGNRRRVSGRIVRSEGGNAPRCYRLERQCAACGEFRGTVNLMPSEGVVLDTRSLCCRCVSIPCRYCQDGRVRRPLTEHFDPERRAGYVPWFGYLVPCGGCQAEGRGPVVFMSI